MTSITFFFFFIPLLAFILLAINLILAPHNAYEEKESAFECGFHSFLGQNRSQFNISFFIFALLFLLFDLEILLVYPYAVSAYTNNLYGLTLMLIFFLILTLGFVFELGKGALKLSSRQDNLIYNNSNTIVQYVQVLPDNNNINFASQTRRVKLHTAPITRQRRLYTTLSRSNITLKKDEEDEYLLSKPILIYENTLLDKDLIIKENINKCGIYMWKNKVDGKSYVGSAINLGRRLSRYFQPIFIKHQLLRNNSYIYRALMKHGYGDFKLLILEYCEPSNLITTEQKYINLYKPKYNILLLAASRLGHKVSDKTKALISAAVRGTIRREETRLKLRLLHGTPVIVFDLLENKSTEYVSISAAARFFNVYPKKISRIVHSNKLYLDRYKILPKVCSDADSHVAKRSSITLNSIALYNKVKQEDRIKNKRLIDYVFNKELKINIFLLIITSVFLMVTYLYLFDFFLLYIKIYNEYALQVNRLKIDHFNYVLQHRFVSNYSSFNNSPFILRNGLTTFVEQEKLSFFNNDWTFHKGCYFVDIFNKLNIVKLIVEEANLNFSSMIVTSPIISPIINEINSVIVSPLSALQEITLNISSNPLGIQGVGINRNSSVLILNNSIATNLSPNKELLNYTSNILYCLVNNLSPSLY